MTVEAKAMIDFQVEDSKSHGARARRDRAEEQTIGSLSIESLQPCPFLLLFYKTIHMLRSEKTEI